MDFASIPKNRCRAPLTLPLIIFIFLLNALSTTSFASEVYPSPYGKLEQDLLRVFGEGGCSGFNGFNSFAECMQFCKLGRADCIKVESCKANDWQCIKWTPYTPNPGYGCLEFCTSYPSNAWPEKNQDTSHAPNINFGEKCEQYLGYADCMARCDEKTNPCAAYDGPCNLHCEYFAWAEGLYPEKPAPPAQASDIEAVAPEECPEKYCEDGVLYYDMFIDEATGECTYYTFTCGDGCNAEGSDCLKPGSAIKNLTFKAHEGLLHNGRSTITVRGKATFSNPGNIPQNRSQTFKTDGVFIYQGKELSPDKAGIRVRQAAVDATGNLKLDILSEKAMPTDMDPEDVALRIWLEDLPDVSTEIPIIWPGPRAEIIKRKKDDAWQDATATYEVRVKDPDGNLEAYTLSARHGMLRTFGLDWDERKKKTIYTISLPEEERNTLQFAWKAPALSENMALDLMADIRDEFKETLLKEGIKLTVNEATAAVFTLGFGPLAKDYAPDVGALMDTKNLDERKKALQQQLARYYRISLPGGKQLQGLKDAKDDFDETIGKVRTHVTDQSGAMGTAYEEEASTTELAFRGGSIALDSIRLKDGVQTLFFNLTGQDEPYLVKMVGLAEEATIGSAQKTLEYLADNMKAGRARTFRLPFRIYVTVTDKDGYQSHTKAVVWVQGYESLIQ